MFKKSFVPLIICLVFLLTFVAACSPAADPAPAAPSTEPSTPEPSAPEVDPVAEFYKGKTVTIMAGPAGSGVDVVARLFAKYFEEETGSRVLVENYSEIGGLQSMNLTYRAKADGLTFGCHMGDTTIQNWLLDEPAALYDLNEFGFIGSSSLAPMSLWATSDGPYNTIEKLKEGKDILLGGGSKLGYIAFWGSLGSHLLDLDFNTVIGLGGPPACKMSVMQDETQFTNIAIHTPGIAPDLTPLVLLTAERHDLMPNVPALPEVVNLTKEQEDMLILSDLTTAFGPWFVLPPNVPEDRTAYVQKVFDEITTSDKFAKEAIELLGVWGTINAKDMEEGVQYLISSKAEFEAIRKLVEGYYR